MKKSLLAASVLICGLSVNSVYAAPPQHGQEQPGFSKDHGHKGQPNNQKNPGHHKDSKGSSAQFNSSKQEQQNRSKPQGMNQSHHGSSKSGNKSVPSYSVNSRNKQVMHQHYQKILGKVNRQHRPQFTQSRSIPVKYRPYITPAPNSLKKRIPHVPAGYSIGYYQGYVVVYDPKTFVILTLVDLLLNY